VLLLRLDFVRRIERGLVSNSPLDFKQFSLTHVTQISGIAIGWTAFPASPFPTGYGPVSGFPFRL